jgi:hypothetical protein
MYFQLSNKFIGELIHKFINKLGRSNLSRAISKPPHSILPIHCLCSASRISKHRFHIVSVCTYIIILFLI